ncbi:hypothetical protein ACOMICROBIO_FLGHMIGD_01811 [Vibrio sp. B1FLJ16]|nr:hypothetical protein ACOMICROBIO_FLGHMIGD_01811 [Vibrio sp. B1FLJ16]CAE6906711.1 hypothetical protein ACOMICROBIO_FLGHMIGD_01811 [Vibrio sp. B1FLJ16]
MTRAAKGLRIQASCVVSAARLVNAGDRRLKLGSIVGEIFNGHL